MSSPHPERIGRYTILERLAVGGMAQVYLGFEPGEKGLQRVVVIKQILPQLAQDSGFLNMFQQEAQLAARINHPNVVEIHELGESDDQPYIAMEYVGGVALNVLIRTLQEQKSLMPVGVAVGIILQACAGAHAAHELHDHSGQPANLVHRDLTPHNLMVTELGHLKVLDFGVAKATTNREKTQTGLLKGKLPYMSPEQLWQADLDRRSDVFTLGVVLWELLLGSRLFSRDSDVATVNAVLNDGISSLGRVRDDVPDAIQGVGLQALAKKPDDRFETADAFRRALGAASRDAGMDTSVDAIADFVRDVMGDRLSQRRQEITARVERSLATLNLLPPILPRAAPPSQEPRKKTGALIGVVIGSSVTAVVAIALLVALIWGDILQPSKEMAQALEAPVEGEPLTIVFAPTMSEETLLEELDPLRTYLERALGRPVQYQVAQTYGEAAKQLVDGKVPFASLPPNLYVQTRAEHPAVRIVAVKIHGDSHGSDGVFLASDRSGVKTVEAARGKWICYSDTKSTTSYIFPRARLRAADIDPDLDMAGAHVSGNHLQLLKDLIAGKCDVGGTFMDNYMNAPRKNVNSAKIRVLEVTGRTPHDPICAGPSATDEEVQALQKALLSFNPERDVGVAELGAMERLTGFSEIPDSAYDPLRDALKAEQAASTR